MVNSEEIAKSRKNKFSGVMKQMKNGSLEVTTLLDQETACVP